MTNLKDKITNLCGSLILAATAVATFAISMNLPTWVPAVCGLVAALSTATIAYFTGKGPDGKPIAPPTP